MKKLLPFTLMLLSATLLLLPGCDDEPKVTETWLTGTTQEPAYLLDTYTIADSTGDWGYPSPYAHYSRGPGYIRMSFIFETLVWKDADGFVPQLAKDWTYDEAGNAYTFTLQDNVTWHDGTPFTADDVAFTYTYTEDHPYQWVDNGIVESATAIDEHTVKITLSKPYAPFFQDVAGAQPIMPKHIWESVTAPEEFLGPEAVIGTGPYTLGDYSQEHGSYLYQAYDDYYLGKPAVRELRFVKIAEEMNPAALKEGTADSASVQAEVLDDITAAEFDILTCDPNWNAKLTINHQKAPLDTKEFRQALAYAIDRDLLVDIVLRGQGVAGSTGMMPPTSTWYNPDIPQYDFDLDACAALLEGLGYTRNDDYYEKDGETLELSLIAAATFKDLGQFVTSALEDAGIKIDFQTLEAKTVDTRVEVWDFDLSLYGHGGIFEPSILQRVILSKGFNSARYIADEELTALLNDQLNEMDPAARKAMVMQIQELYAEDLPALTLYYPTSYWACIPDLPLYYTMDGVAIGIPIPLNRMSFVR